jgi:hypothetical protein
MQALRCFSQTRDRNAGRPASHPRCHMPPRRALGLEVCCSPTRPTPKLKWRSSLVQQIVRPARPSQLASCISFGTRCTLPKLEHGAVHYALQHIVGEPLSFGWRHTCHPLMLIGLRYLGTVQYSTVQRGLHAPLTPPRPPPLSSLCPVHLTGWARHSRAIAGQLGQACQARKGAVALSSGTSLGAQFNFSRDKSAILPPLLHRSRGASESKGPRHKLPHHSPSICMQLGCDIPSKAARIPWFAPHHERSISTCPPGRRTAPTQAPLLST